MECTHPSCAPSAATLRVLRDPTLWACKACGSTDGLWVCVACGHVGCGRRSHLPHLGGGHARHHFLISGEAHCMSLDIVSKALHCYSCDDWIVRSPPWLDGLRAEVLRHSPDTPALTPTYTLTPYTLTQTR